MPKTKRLPKTHPPHPVDDDFEDFDEDEGEGLMSADTIALLEELKAMAEAIPQAPDHETAAALATALADRISAALNPPAPVPAPEPAP